MISSDVHAATCRISEVAGATITCGNKVTVKTENDADKAAIAKLAVGSIIEAPTDNIRASDIKIAEADAGGWGTPLALLFSIAMVVLYAWIVTARADVPDGYWRVMALVLGQDNRYSNSKVQAAAWMGVLLISFMGICFLRWWSGMSWRDATNVGISDNLLTMAGLSAAAAAAAKITTATKMTTAAPADAAKKSESAEPHFWHDLFHNDVGAWDIGDAQMIVVTAVSIVLFLVNVGTVWENLQLAAHIDLPSPTNALTFAFGGSLGGYLAKKVGGTVGQS